MVSGSIPTSTRGTVTRIKNEWPKTPLPARPVRQKPQTEVMAAFKKETTTVMNRWKKFNNELLDFNKEQFRMMCHGALGNPRWSGKRQLTRDEFDDCIYACEMGGWWILVNLENCDQETTADRPPHLDQKGLFEVQKVLLTAHVTGYSSKAHTICFSTTGSFDYRNSKRASVDQGERGKKTKM